MPAFNGVGDDDPRNGAINTFLQAMRDEAGITELDASSAADIALANGGLRASNVRAQNRACSSLVTVQC